MINFPLFVWWKSKLWYSLNLTIHLWSMTFKVAVLCKPEDGFLSPTVPEFIYYKTALVCRAEWLWQLEKKKKKKHVRTPSSLWWSFTAYVLWTSPQCLVSLCVGPCACVPWFDTALLHWLLGPAGQCRASQDNGRVYGGWRSTYQCQQQRRRPSGHDGRPVTWSSWQKFPGERGTMYYQQFVLLWSSLLQIHYSDLTRSQKTWGCF